jgi:hypothetical protein
MRGGEDERLVGRQAVNADIEEAGHYHAQQYEKDYAQAKHVAIYFACIGGYSQYGIGEDRWILVILTIVPLRFILRSVD